MCPKCQSDATSHKCIRCGKSLGDKMEDPIINPNFDAERFEKLSNGTYGDDIDHELIKQIMG